MDIIYAEGIMEVKILAILGHYDSQTNLPTKIQSTNADQTGTGKFHFQQYYDKGRDGSTN